MTVNASRKMLAFNRTAVRRIGTTILFLLIAALVEFLAVLYAISQGTEDPSVLQYSFIFPGTQLPLTLTLSPLFHLIPVAVIITLAFSWAYLAKKMRMTQYTTKIGTATGTRQVKQPKRTLGIVRITRRYFRRIRSVMSRATLGSALTVFLAFMLFLLIFVLLTYPQLIYRGISSAYQNNSPLRGFVRFVGDSAQGFAKAVSPIGWIATGINNGLLAASSTIKGIGIAFGNIIKPLASLDNAGKYLIFQNAAAWISVFTVLFYGEYWRKRTRYRK